MQLYVYTTGKIATSLACFWRESLLFLALAMDVRRELRRLPWRRDDWLGWREWLTSFWGAPWGTPRLGWGCRRWSSGSRACRRWGTARCRSAAGRPRGAPGPSFAGGAGALGLNPESRVQSPDHSSCACVPDRNKEQGTRNKAWAQKSDLQAHPRMHQRRPEKAFRWIHAKTGFRSVSKEVMNCLPTKTCQKTCQKTPLANRGFDPRTFGDLWASVMSPTRFLWLRLRQFASHVSHCAFSDCSYAEIVQFRPLFSHAHARAHAHGIDTPFYMLIEHFIAVFHQNSSENWDIFAILACNCGKHAVKTVKTVKTVKIQPNEGRSVPLAPLRQGHRATCRTQPHGVAPSVGSPNHGC